MKFDEKIVTNRIIEFIKNYFKENNLNGVVVGISGGKDSAVVAGLFSMAIGKENVLGLWMPCNSSDIDKEHAYLLKDYFGFDLAEFDLNNIYENYFAQIKNLFSQEKNHVFDNSNLNIKPRLRMLTLYYYAALMSSIKRKKYIVAGTSNKSELFVGYFTKGGDNVSDIEILSDLTKEEVIKIGKYINVPSEILFKKPADGLSNKTDEEKLGVTYRDINKVIYNKEIDFKTLNKVNYLHSKNKHKLKIPKYINNHNGGKINE